MPDDLFKRTNFINQYFQPIIFLLQLRGVNCLNKTNSFSIQSNFKFQKTHLNHTLGLHAQDNCILVFFFIWRWGFICIQLHL